MFLVSIIFLQVLFQFSFCSLDTQEISFIFKDCPAKSSFIEAIQGIPADFRVAVPIRDQYDQIIFGKETFISVFEKLKYHVMYTFNLLHFSERFAFTELVDENFYIYLRTYYSQKPKEFLLLALNSGLSFQWFILYVGFFEKVYISLTTFINFIYLAESTFKGANEFTELYPREDMNSFFLKIAPVWTNNKLKQLFEPFNSAGDWKDRKEIIKLHLNLFSTACFSLSPILDLSLADPEFSEEYLYSFLYNNFKVNADGEMDLADYQKVFEKLEEFDRNRQKSPKPKVPFYTKIEDRYLALFLLYSEYFIKIPTSQEKLCSLRIELICLSIVLRGETEFKEFRLDYHMKFENLVAYALRHFKSEIRKKLAKDFAHCDLITEHFKEWELVSSESAMNILQNYAEGGDDRNVDWGVSRWMIKIYLYLFHYYQTEILKNRKQ
jgi:hypothetical protein